jgi:hypothetical protein
MAKQKKGKYSENNKGKKIDYEKRHFEISEFGTARYDDHEQRNDSLTDFMQ